MATLKKKSAAISRSDPEALTTERILLFAQCARASGMQHAATVFRAMADNYVQGVPEAQGAAGTALARKNGARKSHA